MKSPSSRPDRSPSGFKINQLTLRVEGLLLAGLLGSLVCVVLLQTASRRLPIHLIWTDEVSRFLLVWLVFFGGAYSVGTGAVLVLDLLRSKVGWHTNRLLDTAALILSMLVCAYIVYLSPAFLRTVSSQEAVTSGLPMMIVYLAVPIGFLLSFWHLAFNARRAFTRPGDN